VTFVIHTSSYLRTRKVKGELCQKSDFSEIITFYFTTNEINEIYLMVYFLSVGTDHSVFLGWDLLLLEEEDLGSFEDQEDCLL